jgi:hypothetical protein
MPWLLFFTNYSIGRCTILDLLFAPNSLPRRNNHGVPRLHLFEFEDQRWFPSVLRNSITRYLEVTYRFTPFPRLWAQRLSELMREDQLAEIVDLGSGAGGPISLVLRELERLGFKAHATLTDLFPNALLVSAPLDYWPQPVDATSVPATLLGIRTMFAAFHHFKPEAARQILRDAFEHRRPICIFEATSRTPAAIASALLIPLLVLALTPRIRPVSWIQILLTYMPPILPLLILWEGLVSQLRTYSVRELKDLTSDLRSPDYTWEAGLIKVPRLPAGTPYLLGRPEPQIERDF